MYPVDDIFQFYATGQKFNQKDWYAIIFTV